MLNAIIRAALNNRLLTISLAALLFVYGTLVVIGLPVDVFPDLNRPTVTIQVEAGGLAPEEVETLVIQPIETAMNGATGVDRVRSTAGIGLAQIFVEFGWGTDIYIDRQIVAEKLNGIRERLPADVEPQMAPIASIMGQIMLIGLVSPDSSVDGLALRELADWTIRPRLQSISGVAQVISIGGGVRQYQVQLRPERLANFHISLTEVRTALEHAQATAGGGFLDQGEQEFLIRGLGRIGSLADLRAAVITERDGLPITIGDVATVTFGARPKRGDAGVNGKPGVIISIQKQPGASTIELTQQVEDALEELRSSLPAGVELNTEVFRQSNFIEHAIGNVQEAMRDGAILVTIVLFLFLLNFRTTIITITAIPLSLLLSALVFHFFGLSVNTMTLGGLAVAIGELVDDAIVDVENVHRRLKENKFALHPKPTLQVVFEASSEVRNSIVYATIIISLVFLPLFFLGGLEGRLFQPLGIAYICALLSSLLVSLTVTPAMASYLLPSLKYHAVEAEGWLVRQLKRLDLRLLHWTLDHSNVVLWSALALVLISFSLFPLMGREFLPPFNEGSATINLLLPPGTNLDTSNAAGQKAEELLLTVPEVVSTGRRTGRAEEDDHAEGPHSSEIEVEFREGRPKEVVLADIRTRMATIPNATVNVGQPISHRLDHLLSGVQAQVAVKLIGDDLPTLRMKSEEIREVMARIPGVVDLNIEKQVPIPQLQIQINRTAAAQYGIQVGELAEDLEIALSQDSLGQVLEGQRAYDLVVMLEPAARANPGVIGDLLVARPNGTAVPLRLVSKILPTEGPNQILHENIRRRIVISANVQGRDLGATVDDIQRTIDRQVTLPAGYHVKLEGQFEAQRTASRMILIVGIGSVIGIFLILFMHFGLARVALQVMSNLPLAVVGGVIAVFLTGGVLSIASMVGFITVFGIASRNGIMMISHYIHLMEHEGEGFTREMVIRGSLERLVPVLMTALTAMLGLIPLALASGVPGKELLQPIAVVILGGLISSTLLDMAVTPALFYRFGRPVYDRIIAKREALAVGRPEALPLSPITRSLEAHSS